MNKTNIEWTDWTLNPVVGCRRGCSYCYGPRLAKRWGIDFSEPKFYPERLKEPAKIKQPSKIFVCSFGELFGDWIPSEWIEAVLGMVKQNPHHIFQLLTKNPKRYSEFAFPSNCWLGTTVTGDSRICLEEKDRIAYLRSVPSPCHFVSVEPLLGSLNNPALIGSPILPMLKHVDWIIVGALTYARAEEAGKYQATYLKEIMDYAKEHKIPLFVKNNMALREPVREYPKTKIEYMEYGTDIRTGEVGEC